MPEGRLALGAEVGFDLPSIWSATGISAKLVAFSLGFLGGFAPGAIYFTALESSGWQATLGKRVAGLQVADLTGRRISPWRAFLPYMGRWVSLVFWPLAIASVVAVALTKRNRALHDQLSGCVVTRR